jgi:hypothetical protein
MRKGEVEETLVRKMHVRSILLGLLTEHEIIIQPSAPIISYCFQPDGLFRENVIKTCRHNRHRSIRATLELSLWSFIGTTFASRNLGVDMPSA